MQDARQHPLSGGLQGQEWEIKRRTELEDSEKKSERPQQEILRRPYKDKRSKKGSRRCRRRISGLWGTGQRRSDHKYYIFRQKQEDPYEILQPDMSKPATWRKLESAPSLSAIETKLIDTAEMLDGRRVLPQEDIPNGWEKGGGSFEDGTMLRKQLKKYVHEEA
ncbi:uncharacterized protein KY384_000025 [Bacidia gigantensis]|uniref:uncharacterized protein n=1 Tax=Bacidia gigantensis TaxID=2732470 RepID=UPI001D03A8A8|nr:uncharacterized protein KY384_000025 [Bacidia gigantensis]KAG8526432.1 hypothetical protein KY384_000025 [Bacidia gigantensis]